MYANHGALVKHQHEMEGINSRIDGLQASLLTAKLKHVDAWTPARRRVAARYDRLLAGVGDLELPRSRRRDARLSPVRDRHRRRDELKTYLAARGIETAVHYPTALPLLPAYRYLGMSRESMPRAAANQSGSSRCRCSPR